MIIEASNAHAHVSYVVSNQMNIYELTLVRMKRKKWIDQRNSSLNPPSETILAGGKAYVVSKYSCTLNVGQ